MAYSKGIITIPKVTGDIVITVATEQNASPVVEVPIVFNEGETCNYTVGQSMATLTSSGSYCTSDLFELKPGVTYTLYVNATADSSFRLVGGNDSGTVTEICISPNFAKGENTFTFTPASGTTKGRIRTYAGFSNSEWKLTYEQ